MNNRGIPFTVNRLKVAYLIQNVGGIDLSRDIGDAVPVKQTIRGLKRAGHEVSVIRLDGSKVAGIDRLEDLNEVWQAPTGVSGKKLFQLFERGVRRVQRELGLPYFAFFDTFRFYEAGVRILPGYDLCHEHNGLFSLGAALACRRLQFPFILTFSADPILERRLVGNPLSGVHGAVAAWEARLTYEAADRIICVSEPAKRHLIDNWGVDANKIAVLPNGVDVQLFGREHDVRSIRTRLGWDSAPVVSFVGSFQLWHGLDRLVESFAKVVAAAPQARLLLVGDGPARELVEQSVRKLGIQEAVRITGFVSQDCVTEMLAVTDVAVLPYPALPQDLWFSPLKLYEYMAAGKAIVASRSGQIAEVIRDGENGLLVTPGDTGELAESLLRLIRAPEERSWLGANARQQAVERHSWDQYVQRVEEIYRSVL